MSYKWKPSKSAKRVFAQKMQDPTEAQAYEDRKKAKADKRRASSDFNYHTAGGLYTPTKAQQDAAMTILTIEGMSEEQRNAANMVTFGNSCNEKIHHDFIHIVNEYIRSKNT